MSRSLNIVADSDIPYLKGVLEPFANVTYIKGADISNRDLKSVDALLVRTRTKCNRALLDGTDVRFIASATIGVDHIDTDYCSANGILVKSAPGSNSGAVMQYLFTSLYSLATKKNIDISGMTLGVVGVGNVGSKVAALAEYLGFKVLLNDPPRSAVEGGELFTDLDALLGSSDIVTMHTPLDGKTYGMVNASFLSKMKKGAIFINSSRGEVTDEIALKEASIYLSGLILDVWANEPMIDPDLLKVTDIATPHIAGYSIEGKMNATTAVVRALAEAFGIGELINFQALDRDMGDINLIDFTGMSLSEVSERLQEIFPIWELDALLRGSPALFEQIRMNYRYRKEFYVYKR